MKTIAACTFLFALLVMPISAGRHCVDAPRAALPNSSCMRTFSSCRTTCIVTFAPDEQDDIIINNPMANACLLDCDVDLAACIINVVSTPVVTTIINALPWGR